MEGHWPPEPPNSLVGHLASRVQSAAPRGRQPPKPERRCRCQVIITLAVRLKELLAPTFWLNYPLTEELVSTDDWLSKSGPEIKEGGMETAPRAQIPVEDRNETDKTHRVRSETVGGASRGPLTFRLTSLVSDRVLSFPDD